MPIAGPSSLDVASVAHEEVSTSAVEDMATVPETIAEEATSMDGSQSSRAALSSSSSSSSSPSAAELKKQAIADATVTMLKAFLGNVGSVQVEVSHGQLHILVDLDEQQLAEFPSNMAADDEVGR